MGQTRGGKHLIWPFELGRQCHQAVLSSSSFRAPPRRRQRQDSSSSAHRHSLETLQPACQLPAPRSDQSGAGHRGAPPAGRGRAGGAGRRPGEGGGSVSRTTGPCDAIRLTQLQPGKISCLSLRIQSAPRCSRTAVPSAKQLAASQRWQAGGRRAVGGQPRAASPASSHTRSSPIPSTSPNHLWTARRSP